MYNILIVDDEVRIRSIIKKYAEFEGHSVTEAGDGMDAVRLCRENVYDIIILDIMMPGKDGFSVLREMRAKGNKTPVLILSAKSEVDDKVRGLDLGANDYLTKPFSVRELLARIRAITRSSEGQLDSNLKFNNITLNIATYELSGSTGSVKLANKEFQMLEMLMRNPSHLISTEKFMEKIWGYDSDSEINVVWVYISYLRRKLAAIGANVEIRSHRNSGYSLEKN